MIKDIDGLTDALVDRARELGAGCGRVFVSVSGGVDSSLVAAILCRAFGPDKVVGMHRRIRSDAKHMNDVRELQRTLGFKLIVVEADAIYDMFIAQMRDQFKTLGLPWAKEGTPEADALGLTNAYSSLKSRFTTPFAGFVAKAADNGGGRIFGTGNGEEDGLLRYFDKFGDGAVDSNILNGLTKAEVKTLAAHMSVPAGIVLKIPSADLEACGDDHNDEGQLTGWARKMGHDICVSYGAPDGSREGNIAWAWKEDIRLGVITGERSALDEAALTAPPFSYSAEQAHTVLFLRKIECSTRHKVEPIPGLERRKLMEMGLVD